VTVILTIGLLAVGDRAVAARRGNRGEVVLVCTLGLSVLHATPISHVALVDVTQHMARLFRSRWRRCSSRTSCATSGGSCRWSGAGRT